MVFSDLGLLVAITKWKSNYGQQSSSVVMVTV